MDKSLEIIINFRKFLLAKIETLTVEQLNTIPEHFSNNIIWNVAHMNAVLQALCYANSGLPILVDENYFHPFLPGTKPVNVISENKVNNIKEQFITSLSQLNKDLDLGLFRTYKKAEKIEKVYNINVETIDDAIKYVTHHDGSHYHAILALKRTIESQT